MESEDAQAFVKVSPQHVPLANIHSGSTLPQHLTSRSDRVLLPSSEHTKGLLQTRYSRSEADMASNRALAARPVQHHRALRQ